MEKLKSTIQQFNHVAGEIDAAYHTASVKLGLTDSERDILYILSQESVSQSDICAYTGMSKQTVNSSVQKMIQSGILNPLSGERKEKLTFTEKGKDHVSQTVDKLIQAENRIFTHWSKKEQQEFIALNQKYLEMFLKELEEF